MEDKIYPWHRRIGDGRFACPDGKTDAEKKEAASPDAGELAEKAGITPQTVSTAELGKKAMKPETIVCVCKALQVSTDYLLLGSIGSDEQNELFMRISRLSTNHYRYLEEIIMSYLSAVEPKTQSGIQKDK